MYKMALIGAQGLFMSVRLSANSSRALNPHPFSGSELHRFVISQKEPKEPVAVVMCHVDFKYWLYVVML